MKSTYFFLLSGLIILGFSVSIFINKKQKGLIMSKIDDINAQLAGIDDATNNIAADLERIAGDISGGVSASDADGVIAKLQAAATKLKAIADLNPEPETPE